MPTEPLSLLSHDAVEEALSTLEMPPAAAEIHGHLLGCVAAGGAALAEWLARVGDEVPTGPLSEPARQALAQLYQQTMALLAEQQLELELLMPPDDLPLTERLESLALWCQGFLAGYGLSPRRQSDRSGSRPSAEVEEVLNDFAAIVQVDVDIEDSESAERDLFELTEYVRMVAMQWCWDSQNSGRQADEATPTGGMTEPAGPAQFFRGGGSLH